MNQERTSGETGAGPGVSLGSGVEVGPGTVEAVVGRKDHVGGSCWSQLTGVELGV